MLRPTTQLGYTSACQATDGSHATGAADATRTAETVEGGEEGVVGIAVADAPGEAAGSEDVASGEFETAPHPETTRAIAAATVSAAVRARDKARLG